MSDRFGTGPRCPANGARERRPKDRPDIRPGTKSTGLVSSGPEIHSGTRNTKNKAYKKHKNNTDVRCQMSPRFLLCFLLAIPMQQQTIPMPKPFAWESDRPKGKGGSADLPSRSTAQSAVVFCRTPRDMRLNGFCALRIHDHIEC